jgi:cytochrome c biogenesis protein CcmG/thiol:disulfide interchange protein DsbE
MTTKTRAPHIEPRNRAATLPVLVLAAVVVAALAALVATLINDDESAATNFDTDLAAVEGNALVAPPGTGTDPAVGQKAPVVEGHGLTGTQVTAPVAGKPTVVLFLAHWCPHCRREVPVVQSYVDAGRVPEGVDLVAVATAMDPAKPNYPPSSWLESEGWTSPVLADGNGDAATAYGLPAFPYWVAVDADGRVVERRTGELTPGQMDDLFAAAQAQPSG